MTHLSATEMEQQALELRAEEIRQVEALVAVQTPVESPGLGDPLLSGLGAVSELIRPLFSWNPQRASRPEGV